MLVLENNLIKDFYNIWHLPFSPIKWDSRKLKDGYVSCPIILIISKLAEWMDLIKYLSKIF